LIGHLKSFLICAIILQMINIQFLGCERDSLVAEQPVPSSAEPHFLEYLSYKYGSDKSKDDHKYTDLYQMLFDNSRLSIQNITEIGANAGQSIQAWYEYFPNAHIFTYDVKRKSSMDKIAELYHKRVHYQIVDLVTNLDKTGLKDETMDLVVEDASHKPLQQRALLLNCFRLVKPGGYYIIEDISFTSKGGRNWQRNISSFGPEVQSILQENDSIFVDTHIGHRDWEQWKEIQSARWVADDINHNSYLLIVRKRSKPLSKDIKMNYGVVAMQVDKVVL